MTDNAMTPPTGPTFDFDNSYATELGGLYTPWRGARVPEPRIVALNRALASELGLDADSLDTKEGAAILSGSSSPQGAAPLAQAYAGHQFGGFSPQLGDGRALLVGELIGRDGTRRDLHLKGSGRTPFSRGGDGKAVLGPVLREYLMGEAMHALGVPTTRALAAVTTGEQVMRQRYEPGAVLARVASSHLRVGTFEFFSAREDTEKVRRLADYAIRRHYPELLEAEDPYLELFRAVRDRQAGLVAHWMSIGFVHGVMNTDNTTISGETIDYGPCAFVDGYDPRAVFSSIDRGGRYAYGNQPAIAQWNLARFVETLLPLLTADDLEDAVRIATVEIEAYPEIYRSAWLSRMGAKIGLAAPRPEDAALIDELLATLHESAVDFTSFFRRLADVARGSREPARALFADPARLDGWLDRWQALVAEEGPLDEARASAMDRVNPVYIPRNHKVEEALAAANEGDFAPFERLGDVLSQPFERRDGLEAYEGPAPEDFGPYRTFCGT